MMREYQVLIAGAGPTGLTLALFLTRQGIRVRIIDKNAKPGEASRAIVVQARTLEFYKQLGFADEVVARGIRVNAIHLRQGSHRIGDLQFGDFGGDLSPFPFVLAFAQDEHEELLVEELKKLGVHVERDTELVDMIQLEDRVQAFLKKQGISEQCEVAYLCGCDGAHSTVRQKLKINFSGGSYNQLFYVADVIASGRSIHDGLNVALAEKNFCIILPVRKGGTLRLIGIVPSKQAKQEKIMFEDIQSFVEKLTGLRIKSLNWFSTYHVHHRVAENFNKGRVFILGDAAHIHSPAGGQGMNTGIGDAVNLAWKMASVLHGKADRMLLDTYPVERMAFARTLVATTDQIFKFMVDPSWVGRFWRRRLFPAIMSFLLKFRWVRRAMFRLVSQVRIHYHNSPISFGRAGKLHAGDRLPYVKIEESDNFEPLKKLNWHIHIYGLANQDLHQAADQLGLDLCVFEWNDGARQAGFVQDALYLVRPDGHIAFIDAYQNVQALNRYWSKR